MDRGRLTWALLLAALVFVFGMTGCTTQDDSEPAEAEMMSGTTTVFVKHQVADYAAWRSVYDADAPRREEAGLTEVGVFRGADNDNMVVIVGETNDLDAFKEMVESPDLGDKMAEAGVVGQPEAWLGMPVEAGSGTVFLMHEVADYSAWRPVYDADAARRMDAGLQEVGVFQDSANENMLLLVWTADDVAPFKAMMVSPELADKMREAGVISEPQAWMGEPVME